MATHEKFGVREDHEPVALQVYLLAEILLQGEARTENKVGEAVSHGLRLFTRKIAMSEERGIYSRVTARLLAGK